MAKRPKTSDEDIAQSRVKQKVRLRDDGRRQGSDVDVDTINIQDPPSTDVQLGSSSSTSQVASHVVRFGVADIPPSNMVEGQWLPDERSSLDKDVLECISWGDREEGRADLLPVILKRITRQADNEISIEQAMDLLSDKSLQETLTAGWKRGSFEDIRCLEILKSTSPIPIPPADDVEMAIRPQGTDVTEFPPSTSQPDLAVPGEPTSEMVEDKREPDVHAAFDIQINKSFQLLMLDMEEQLGGILLALLVKIAQQNNHTIDLATAANMMKQKQYKWLRDFLIGKWRDGSFTEARRLKILQPASARSSLPPEDIAMAGPVTVNSWKTKFKGQAANALLETISVYLVQDGVYARHANIVNSSGTGKSRMVDELGKTIITVPMCLRDPQSSGFPPSDTALHKWLHDLNTDDQRVVARLLHGLLSSLLDVTLQKLKAIDNDLIASGEVYSGPRCETVKIRQKLLASRFRDKMTEGSRFEEANEYRRTFFENVTEQADKFATKVASGIAGGSHTVSDDDVKHGVFQAGNKLKNFIDNDDDIRSIEIDMKWPLVVLAFDEAHNLTEVPNNRGWSMYSELRRCLCQLLDFPMFTLFLSTAGKFRLFSPHRPKDLSTRVVQGHKRVLPPITETGFDQLALRAKENQTSLDQVVGNEWISRLGRPLFASRHVVSQPGDRIQTTALQFATQKLLGGHNDIDEDADDTWASPLDRSLACLSVRFPLEFDFSDTNTRSLVRKQIEHHMRLCTIATSSFEVLFSTVGSEPLLAEAAAEAMSKGNTNPVRLLSNLLGKNCIHHGDRGEPVAALLVMQARDALTRGKESKRWVYVCDFLESLLGDSANIRNGPSVTFSEKEDRSLKETFKDARMWFNHVLKIRDTDLINVRYLWRFISRGAMILCANNQRGVDIVLPVCYKGDKLSRKNVTAILIQVKNDTNFGENIRGHLFDAMDPFIINLFDKGSQPLPIIRMVFALASKTSAVKHDTPDRSSPRIYTPGGFTSYDIWCAGSSSETFPIMGADEVAYQELLDRTRFRGQEYAVGAIQGMRYPEKVEKKKIALLRNCDPLIETGVEHQMLCKEEGEEAEEEE